MKSREPLGIKKATKLPFPFETLRLCYVTKFGGVSKDLGRYQVGINSQALTDNTKLVEADCVAVGILGKGRTRPYFMEQLYEVMSLSSKTPDAFTKSFMGEAVFSENLNLNRKPFDSLRKGQLIVLSGVLGDSKTRGRRWRLDLLAKTLHDLQLLNS